MRAGTVSGATCLTANVVLLQDLSVPPPSREVIDRQRQMSSGSDPDNLARPKPTALWRAGLARYRLVACIAHGGCEVCNNEVQVYGGPRRIGGQKVDNIVVP